MPPEPQPQAPSSVERLRETLRTSLTDGLVCSHLCPADHAALADVLAMVERTMTVDGLPATFHAAEAAEHMHAQSRRIAELEAQAGAMRLALEYYKAALDCPSDEGGWAWNDEHDALLVADAGAAVALELRTLRERVAGHEKEIAETQAMAVRAMGKELAKVEAERDSLRERVAVADELAAAVEMFGHLMPADIREAVCAYRGEKSRER